MDCNQHSALPASGRLEALTELRGIATLVVLLHHGATWIFLPQNFNTEFFGGILRQGDLGVNIFFVLSGFVIAYSNQKDGRPLRELLIYFLRRAARIFPMYWIAFVAAVPIYWKFAPAALGEVSLNRILHDLLLIPYNNNTMLPGAWTLIFEMIFYLLFIPMLVNRKVGTFIWTILVICILATVVGGAKWTNPWGSRLFSLYVIQFAGGMGAYYWSLRQSLSLHTAHLLVWSGTLLMVLFAVVECITRKDWIPANLHYAACTVVIILGLVNLPSRPSAPSGRVFRILQVLGLYSYSIYLFHIPVQQILVKLSLNLVGSSPGLPVVCVVAVVTIAASLSAGIFMGKFFEIPILNWSKKWICGLRAKNPQRSIPRVKMGA